MYVHYCAWELCVYHSVHFHLLILSHVFKEEDSKLNIPRLWSTFCIFCTEICSSHCMHQYNSQRTALGNIFHQLTWYCLAELFLMCNC